MIAIAEMRHLFDEWSSYLGACWGMPYGAPVCRPLWSWVALGLMAAGALLVVWMIWNMIDYWFKYQAALKAEAHRQATASPEEMAKVKWTGDQVMHESLELDTDVAATIREELDRRRLQEKGLLPRGGRP